jgi:hypothetical protein
MEVPVPKWLRITTLVFIGALGFVSGLFGYSKSLTVGAGIAIALVAEGVSRFVRRRSAPNA